ncbi:uncharacterized protein AMSG_01722 [Thecamonas trahens ATCC 50062]|uniref:IMS import disulfide relay-system CHCH-CHCH-like Cx9C domain-containing protein n=1 Tax=Thecamonas trahens ATCC 50062 TaxID=461836 RepID=A0A0L0DTT4_THETB|nr:hypothetical protein AMSG_01722 [Thecamonas trahens ATCC 50062]KNC55461.1 hypothetical protein AMSG_01722 [Thecamonas trahens ATCC 50062]|eukprot:XP_013761243.1 hypothetical protein AMSG_01722 [Thecamonas trahens ATCC 50062]
MDPTTSAQVDEIGRRCGSVGQIAAQCQQRYGQNFEAMPQQCQEVSIQSALCMMSVACPQQFEAMSECMKANEGLSPDAATRKCESFANTLDACMQAFQSKVAQFSMM